MMIILYVNTTEVHMKKQTTGSHLHTSFATIYLLVSPVFSFHANRTNIEKVCRQCYILKTLKTNLQGKAFN